MRWHVSRHVLSPCLFNFNTDYIMQNAVLDEAQAGIKTAGRNINNLRYAHDTTLMAESKVELKSLLMKVKEDSGKAGLKFNIQKTKIMASGPITPWQTNGQTMETVTDFFIFLGSKITADSDCSHEIKRCLLLGKKSYDQPRQQIKKQRHYLTNKGLSNQSYGFSSRHVWMWESDHKESWASKNWFFWTVVLEKTLESPLDWKETKAVNPKGNQSWVFTGRTDAEAEAPTLWPPDVKNWLTGKDPDAGKDWRKEGEGDDRGWDGWMASLTQWTWVSASSGTWWWTGKPGVLQSRVPQRVRDDWATELNWHVK